MKKAAFVFCSAALSAFGLLLFRKNKGTFVANLRHAFSCTKFRLHQNKRWKRHALVGSTKFKFPKKKREPSGKKQIFRVVNGAFVLKTP